MGASWPLVLEAGHGNLPLAAAKPRSASLISISRVWVSRSARMASAAVSQFRTRRWCVEGIFMSSLYLATVRRVTWIPSACSLSVICSSVNGWRESSSSIIFFTFRLRISSGVALPDGPCTASEKKYRSSKTPWGVWAYYWPPRG